MVMHNIMVNWKRPCMQGLTENSKNLRLPLIEHSFINIHLGVLIEHLLHGHISRQMH